MTNRLPLLPLVQGYLERDPVTAAYILQTMDEAHAVALLKALPPHLCAQVFPYLQVTYAAALIKEIPPSLFESIIPRMKPEQAASILLNFSHEERTTFLNRLPETIKRTIQDILMFPENSAGRIMSTDFLAFHENIKVKEAVQRLRALAHKHAPLSYAYVVDDTGCLVGVLNMRDLLLSPGDSPLSPIMKKNVFAVNGFSDRETVARELSKHHYFAAPVIDADRRLLGIVTADQLFGDVQEEATEDILRMVGAGRDEHTFSPIVYALKKRTPWLQVNLATAFLAAAVVGMFQDLIAKITILAVFLPVVAGQGGNAGAQSLAVVMRGLVMREIHRSNALRLILKETALGVLNGIITGAVTALIAWFWHGNPMLGVVIGLAMIVNLTAAGLSGAAIPLALKGLGMDPAQSSSIILTTITDVVGFFSFLGFAVIFQRYLM